MRLVRHFRYVEKAELQKNGVRKQIPKGDNDLGKILARYPANKRWTYKEISKVFPPEKKITLY